MKAEAFINHVTNYKFHVHFSHERTIEYNEIWNSDAILFFYELDKSTVPNNIVNIFTKINNC